MSIENRSMISAEKWQKYYPVNDYNKTPHAKTYFFHYFLNNSNPDSVVDYINKCKNPTVLTKSDEKHYDLTPLAIACMQGNDRIAAALLDKFIEFKNAGRITEDKLIEYVNVRDQFGWVPLHYACLTSQAIFLKLIQSKANLQAKTGVGATCKDLKSYTTSSEENPKIKQHIQIEDEEGNFVPLADLSDERLKQLTGLDKYTEQFYCPPEEWKTLWKIIPSQTDDLAILALANHVKSQKDFENPPLLTIAKCKDLEKKGILSYELRAGEDLYPGQVIGQYVGKIRKYRDLYQNSIQKCFTSEKDPYAYGCISAQTIGNAMRFMNCGFSNVITVSKIFQGFERPVCVVTRFTPQGESLQWDYGYAHPSGRTYHIPLSQKKILRYYKIGLKNILDNIKKIAPKQNNINNNKIASKQKFDVINFFEHYSKRDFLINNPTIALFLHLKGIVNIKESQKLLVQFYLIQNGFFVLGVNYSIANLIIDFEESIADYTKEEKLMIRHSVLEQIGSVHLTQLLKYLSLFKQKPVVTNKSLVELKYSLSFYDFKLDPDFPLSDDYFVKSTAILLKDICKVFKIPDEDMYASIMLAGEMAIESPYIKNGLSNYFSLLK